MGADPGLVSSADRNFIVSFDKLAEHQPGGARHRFGAVYAFVSGLPVTIFNGVVVIEPASPRSVDEAIAWVADHNITFTVWVREDLAGGIVPAVLARGLVRRPWAEPVMALAIREPAPEPPDGVTVREVEDQAGLEDHVDAMVGSGTPEPVVRALYTSSFIADPDIRIFAAYLDGAPAGHSVAIRSHNVSGVYAVGTTLASRRRGVGTAATWAAVDAGRTWGCSTAVLQASEMGSSVYRAMGFEVVTRYLMFGRA